MNRSPRGEASARGPRSLRARRLELAARVGVGLSPAEFPRLYAAAADVFLETLLVAAAGGDTGGCALVAVGGYGRGELCPGSDLDVVLVHRRRAGVEAIAQRIWYGIWDDGVSLDHSVRTPREALAVAREDLKVALGLLDCRLVAGDGELAAQLGADARELWTARARRWLPELRSSLAERHRRCGEVPFLLEPDLKESQGGLRDIHALRAAAAAAPVLGPLLGEHPLGEPEALLTACRVALQSAQARPSERLALQDQDRVAATLGFEGADALMAAVAGAGREVSWVSADAWRRVVSWLEGPRSRGSRDRPLAAGIVLRDGEISLAAEAAGAVPTAVALRATGLAAAHEVPLSSRLLSRLEAEMPAPGEPWQPEVRDAFVALLDEGERAIPVIEALDQRHLFERVLPEWSAVRNRPQRNAYHRFTVDRHLLETVARGSELVRDVGRPDLLLVAALLHDIGKGYPGDHTEAGTVVVAAVAERMGFSDADVATLVRLVEHHLLLADVATRRDLDDPATVAAVAAAVSDRATLELLLALTEADSLATGPAAWGTWKASLVRDLGTRTARHLAGEPVPAAAAAPLTPQQRALLEAGGLRVLVDASHDGVSAVTVVAPDRRGLLASVSGTLALHGLDVRRALVGGAGETAIDVFEVEPRFGNAPDAARLLEDLEAALAGRLLLAARLEQRARDYRAARPLAARVAEVRVLVDNEASARASVIEIRAPDSPGLLHTAAQVLADLGVNVASARVATLGHEVVDTFYVSEADSGSKLSSDRAGAVAEATRLAVENIS